MMAITYDLYFQCKAPEDVVGFKFFTTGFDRSVAVRGMWKLTCQWLKLFMTPKGSDPLRREAGTEFPLLLGSNIVSLQDLRDVVHLSIEECNRQIRTMQRMGTYETDELLRWATLVKFQLWGADGFEAWVTISNAQGQEITLRLPEFATRK